MQQRNLTELRELFDCVKDEMVAVVRIAPKY